MPAYSTVDDVV